MGQKRPVSLGLFFIRLSVFYTVCKIFFEAISKKAAFGLEQGCEREGSP